MDLKSFVSCTLVQIVNGVADAQVQLKATGALVNPGFSSTRSTRHAMALTDNSGLLTHARNVVFDVAVTAGDGRTAEGGAGIKVLGARFGADGKMTHESASVSRVQFVVPLALPTVASQSELERQAELNKTLDFPEDNVP